MRQEIYLMEKYGLKLPNGSTLFWFEDPVIPPDSDYRITVCVRHATFPITHHVIRDTNNILEISYEALTRTISLPVGNRSIDELVDFLNSELEFGYQVEYSIATNKLTFTSQLVNMEIGPNTTCGELLGLDEGMSTVNGILESRGINLRGTSAYYINSNLRTQNRNPVDRGFSNVILCVIPITKAENAIETYT